MRVTNLPARSNVALGVLGTSRTTWIGRRLPLDLGPFGMAGCQLLVAADYLENLPIGLTGASWTIALPTELRHLGVELFVQAAIMHQATSGPKVIWSNGGVVRIGR